MKEGLRRLRGKIAEARGDQSEKRVEQVLRNHPNVVAARRTTKWGSEDMDGVDIVANIAVAENSNEVRQVEIQVKSSERGIVSFENKKKRKLGSASREQVRRRFMLVNGQTSWQAIGKSIDRQAHQMGIVVEFPRQKPNQEVQVFPNPEELEKAA